MGTVSKHQAGVKDRISELPEALLCHIVSFLPTTWAVRTTVLSKRWTNRWTSLITNLDFEDSREFETDEQGCYDSNCFMNFVDRVFFLRDSLDIKKFRLAISYSNDFSRIDAWICIAVMRNVVELDLYLSDESGKDFDFEMPQSLFKSKTLTILRVSSSFISYDPPTSGCFPSLKFLHVSSDNPYYEKSVETDSEEEYSDVWEPPKFLLICLSSRLKTISITGFKGWPVEREAAKYLLRNGYLLNKMTIYTHRHLICKKEELLKEFLMFHRVMTYQVEFI